MCSFCSVPLFSADLITVVVDVDLPKLSLTFLAAEAKDSGFSVSLLPPNEIVLVTVVTSCETGWALELCLTVVVFVV